MKQAPRGACLAVGTPLPKAGHCVTIFALVASQAPFWKQKNWNPCPSAFEYFPPPPAPMWPYPWTTSGTMCQTWARRFGPSSFGPWWFGRWVSEFCSGDSVAQVLVTEIGARFLSLAPLINQNRGRNFNGTSFRFGGRKFLCSGLMFVQLVPQLFCAAHQVCQLHELARDHGAGHIGAGGGGKSPGHQFSKTTNPAKTP